MVGSRWRCGLGNEGTVWLSQAQMGELFGTTRENVLMHLQNVFSEGELDAPALRIS